MPEPDKTIQSEEDEDLLGWMAMRQEAPEEARAACEEFFQRHLDYLEGVVGRAHRSDLGDAGVEDIVMETFRRVLEYASTYTPCGAMGVTGRRHNVLAWLGAIAKNVANDYFRDANTRLLHFDDWDDLEPSITSTEPHAPSEEERLIESALATLTERERTVLRVTMQFYDPTVLHQRLPNGVAADLANVFNTTPVNIRQIRKRALDKVRDHFMNARENVHIRSEA